MRDALIIQFLFMVRVLQPSTFHGGYIEEFGARGEREGTREREKEEEEEEDRLKYWTRL